MGVHEPKYSSTLPSSEFATGAHLSSKIENELGEAILPSSPRTGYLGYQMITAMEPLFYQYGVDLVGESTVMGLGFLGRVLDIVSLGDVWCSLQACVLS